MDNTEFKKIVQEITSKYGFMYCKKNYYYNSDKIIVVINLQKSNFDNSYYINYGFYVKDIHMIYSILRIMNVILQADF